MKSPLQHQNLTFRTLKLFLICHYIFLLTLEYSGKRMLIWSILGLLLIRLSWWKMYRSNFLRWGVVKTFKNLKRFYCASFWISNVQGFLHFLQLLLRQFVPPEGGQYQSSPAFKITDKIEHICFYVARGILLCRAIYKIAEPKSTQEVRIGTRASIGPSNRLFSIVAKRWRWERFNS